MFKMAAICAKLGGFCKSSRFLLPSLVPNVFLRNWASRTVGSTMLLCGEHRWPYLHSQMQLQKRNITLLTSFNVVDNSQLGQRAKRYRKPYLIGFYRKRKTAEIGDVIRVAVGGKTNKAIVVGTRRTKHHTVPRYDNNNIVLVDDNLAPLGTRIKGPVPTIIKRRQKKYSKVLATASRFI